MKILRIVYDWPPPWDGLAPHPYELTKAQAALGHEFEIFCGRWPSAGKLVVPDNTHVTTFAREPFPGTINLTTSFALLFKYISWRRTNYVDLIHSHGHFAIWIYLYRYLLEKFYPQSSELATPMVVHFHNTVEGRWRSAKERGKQIKPMSQFVAWPLAKLSDMLAVKVASACIFVSDGNRQEALEYYGADPQKSFVVETGVNTELFVSVGPEEKEKTRRDLGLDRYSKVIVNHGVMVERKNIHLLIDALSFLPENYKLLLVGSGDTEYLYKIDTAITDKKLTGRVVRVGYTPYPETPIAFQASDLFILPSSFEGLPKVVMQSLACKVPALVSGFRLSEEISGLYYLENLDPQVIAQRIQEIVNNPQPVDVYKIQKMYSWRERALELDKVYEYIKKA